MKIKALPDKVLVHNMQQGERILSSGIVIMNDDGKESGVRPRWAQVLSVGDNVEGISEGQWVLLTHGRWSRGIQVDDDTTVHMVEVDSMLAVSDNEPFDENVGNSTESGFHKIRM